MIGVIDRCLKSSAAFMFLLLLHVLQTAFFALILRAFSVIEGIALTVDPDYSIVQVRAARRETCGCSCLYLGPELHALHKITSPAEGWLRQLPPPPSHVQCGYIVVCVCEVGHCGSETGRSYVLPHCRSASPTWHGACCLMMTRA